MPITFPRLGGYLLGAALSILLMAGCHDDTPPPDDAANISPIVAVGQPPSPPLAKPLPVPAKTLKKRAKPAAIPKSYLQTDAAGIVILHGQTRQAPDRF